MHHSNAPFQFCPLCSKPVRRLALKTGEPERTVCSSCGYVHYLDPKVVACSVLEMDGGIVLLKRGIQPQKGKWVLPGGYVDRGEPVPQAAVREVREECGLDVRLKHLLGVYSYQDQLPVVIVYVGEPVGGKLLAGQETLEAEVFSLQHFPWDELAFQSTTDALQDYTRTFGGNGASVDTSMSRPESLLPFWRPDTLNTPILNPTA